MSLCKKKAGTLGLCIDWRALNEQLVVDSGGLGDIQTIFDGLKGKKFFTQIDLASGYHQVEIAEKDKYKSAFRDPDGQLYEFNRAGYGLTVLPSAFTSIVQNTLRLPDDDVASWLDDILIASVTWDEHLTSIIKVLSRLLAAGLSVNFAKCIFGAARQEFLGMIIDSTGIRPALSKLEAIEKMPPPSNVEELRAFLGMTGYLRQFIQNYSITAAPLAYLLRNKEFASEKARKFPIAWGDKEAEAFRRLKQTLTSPTVLASPDWNSTFKVQTDASSAGAGAVLLQPEGCEERVLAFASHRFSKTDSRRGPTERECMAVLWAIKYFRQYVAGRCFTLVTDCSALKWLFRSRNLEPKLHRWALSLQEYDIDLRWRAGSANLVPDCLSRLPHQTQTDSHIDDFSRADTSVANPITPSQQSGPTLDGVALQELDPFDEPAAKTKQPIEAAIAEASAATACVLRELPFTTCTSLEDEQTVVRRSGRIRQLSVRLRDPDVPQTHKRRPEQGGADTRPRRQALIPIDMPPKEPHSNQVASTSITVPP